MGAITPIKAQLVLLYVFYHGSVYLHKQNSQTCYDQTSRSPQFKTYVFNFQYTIYPLHTNILSHLPLNLFLAI